MRSALRTVVPRRSLACASACPSGGEPPERQGSVSARHVTAGRGAAARGPACGRNPSEYVIIH